MVFQRTEQGWKREVSYGKQEGTGAEMDGGVKSIAAYEWLRDALAEGKVGGLADDKQEAMSEGV